MSASLTARCPVNIIDLMLATGKDWDDGLARIKSEAVRERFWQCINPELHEPLPLLEPPRPTLLAAGIEDVTSLTSDQRVTFSLLVSNYKDEWKI